MNCHQFQHQIYEYLDGTLSPRTQAAAQKHLHGCFGCRQALALQRQLANSLSNQLRRATETLTLPPEIGDRIKAALAAKRTTKIQEPTNAFNWRRLAWPIALAASVGLAAFLLAGYFLRIPANPVPTEPRAAQDAISINVSYAVPAYTFRREGSSVIDTLNFETNTVNATLWVGNNHKTESKTHKKKLLL